MIERSELQDLRAKLERMEEFEKVFSAEISAMKERNENPQSEAERFYMEHKKKLALDPEYRKLYESSITEGEKRKRRKATNGGNIASIHHIINSIIPDW